jgi:hypothetical protein
VLVLVAVAEDVRGERGGLRPPFRAQLLEQHGCVILDRLLGQVQNTGRGWLYRR